MNAETSHFLTAFISIDCHRGISILLLRSQILHPDLFHDLIALRGWDSVIRTKVVGVILLARGIRYLRIRFVLRLKTQFVHTKGRHPIPDLPLNISSGRNMNRGSSLSSHLNQRPSIRLTIRGLTIKSEHIGSTGPEMIADLVMPFRTFSVSGSNVILTFSTNLPPFTEGI